MTIPSRRDDGAPVADIYRLYCTHCTFGTSVLEKRTTENATRVLGYSVRAASITDREKIQRVFRAIERLLSYDLPKGTPPTDKLTYDAAKAPRRLVFMPRLNDHQVVGLMSYRSQDTAGRPGSYFGDFLVARTGATPSGDWSAVDCLRLWPAAHTGEIVDQWWCDSEERVMADEAAGVSSPLAPETLSRVGGPGKICDETFISFLSAEFGTSFEDPGQVIPPRWAEIPAADRQLLFARLAQATVDVLKSGKGTVTLVVEPSLAALLFYGVCRILPQRLLAADGKFPGLSFSTYDPSPDRATTTLVATVCKGQGADGDLPGEAYKRGFVCNTFVPEFRYGVVSEPGKYVAHVAGFLLRESRVPDEVIREYDALRELSITGIDALPALADDLGQYLHGADRLARYPQLTEKAAESLTPAGKSLRSALVRKRLESLSTPYPPDLLEVVVDWLGNELAGDWKAKGPLYQALLPILPSSEEELEDLIQRAGSKLSQDIRDDAVIKVTLATKVLPKTLAVMAASEKSTAAFCRTIKRLPPERVEDILKEAIERYPRQYLPIFARHFDVIASAAGIQDRQPLASCLLAKAFSGGPLEPSDKWSLLSNCSDSIPNPVPDGVWDDPIWGEDRIEACFSRAQPHSVEWKRRADALIESWARRYDDAKPGSHCALLLQAWRDLISATDKAMTAAVADGANERRASQDAKRTFYEELIKKVSSPCLLPPTASHASRETLFMRAAEMLPRSPDQRASLKEEMERFVHSQIAAKRKENDRANRKADLKKTVVSAKRFATQFAIPAAVSIVVLALLALLVVLVPRLVSMVKWSGKQEQAKKANSPEKSPAPKASQRPVAQALPVAADMASVEETAGEGNSVSESNTIADNSAAARVDVVANAPLPGETHPAAVATPGSNQSAGATPAPSGRVVFPGANPGGEAKDPIEQIRDAVEKQSHRGQVIANVEKFVWGREGAPLDVGRIKLSLPKNDMFWHPENIRVEGQGGFWMIEPNIATVHMDGSGVTIELSPEQTSPNALRASLIPLIISDSGSPQRWTWIDRSTEVDGSFSIPVSGKISADAAVNVHSVYGLRNKVVVEVSPKLDGNPVLSEPWRIRLGEDKVKEFKLHPVAAERGYPVTMRVQCVDGAAAESLALRVSLVIGYFGVTDGKTERLVRGEGDISSEAWVGECVGLMKRSVLWGKFVPQDEYLKKLKEAYRELEAKASESVSNKAYCLSFLQKKMSARVTEQLPRGQFSKTVTLEKSVAYNCESRRQSLRAILQATEGFRQAAINRCGLKVSFPLSEDPGLKEKAKEDLDGRIRDVEGNWMSFFLNDDAFREWCQNVVCSEGLGDEEQTRLLALLWLSLEDSREDRRRRDQNIPSGAEYLRGVSIACQAVLRLEWFPADWGGEGDRVATVTPWSANCTIDMSALPVKALPSATVAPPPHAPAMEKGPLEREVPQESIRGIPVP